MANIGTFLSSLIAIFTLYEVRRQRESSLQPDIVLENIKIIYIKKNTKCKNELSRLLYIWRKNDDFSDIDNKEEVLLRASFPIAFTNIGLGVAKNIRISWHFDIEFFITYLSEKCIIDNVTMFFDEDYNSNLFLRTLKEISFLKGLDETYCFEYLSNNNENGASIEFITLRFTTIYQHSVGSFFMQKIS